MNLDQRIRDRLPFDSAITDQNRHIDDLADALRVVLDLHRPQPVRVGDSSHACNTCSNPPGTYEAWPCRTVTAIARSLGITEEVVR